MDLDIDRQSGTLKGQATLEMPLNLLGATVPVCLTYKLAVRDFECFDEGILIFLEMSSTGPWQGFKFFCVLSYVYGENFLGFNVIAQGAEAVAKGDPIKLFESFLFTTVADSCAEVRGAAVASFVRHSTASTWGRVAA